jgi:hypothetical protein
MIWCKLAAPKHSPRDREIEMPRPIRPLRTLIAAGSLAVLAILIAAPAALAAAAPPIAEAAKPAGGAATGEVVIATAGALLATGALLVLGLLHRAGRTNVLLRAGEKASRQTGLPPWAALPSQLVALSLLVALIGMYWDISLHIDDGRDAGPLANPAHYFILAGLFGTFAAGFLAVVMPEGRPSRVSVPITRDWFAPLGGVVLLATSSFALIGFPLDDFWHRLFGQDVTLWGPTHLMLIGGAGLSLIGHAILLVEGGQQKPAGALGRGILGLLIRSRLAAVCGGLLIGLSTFQAEFDFGVPQFRMVFQPVLIAAAAGIALVAARIYAGRGAALVAVLYFLAIRGLVTVIVGPIAGETIPHFPLYAAEALIVELIALRVSTEHPYRFGALAGLGIGTLGFASEWGWSHLWMPIPWPEPLLAEALPLVPAVGVAAGVLGGFIGTALGAPRRSARFAVPGLAPAAVSVIAIAAVIGYGLQAHPEHGVTAQIAAEELRGGPEREVALTVRVSPSEATKGANWLQAIAWQGGGFVQDNLARVGEGAYRTTKPMPAHGSWKTVVRLHRDDSLLSVPAYMPRDPGIPADGVPLRLRVTRAFVEDHELLQRERKDDVPGWLPAAAYSVVGSIVLGFLGVLGWALARLASGFAGGPEPPAPGGGRAAPVAPATPARDCRRCVVMPFADAVLLLADHAMGAAALGFAVPPLLVIVGLAALVIRERLGK